MSQPTSGTIKVPKSIMKQAIKNDPEALSSIFSQFLAPDEQIYALEYLGTHGLWGLGTRSFTCLTAGVPRQADCRASEARPRLGSAIWRGLNWVVTALRT